MPKHEIMTEEEVKELLEKYKVTKDKLPKIYESDPALLDLSPRPKPGDVIKIYRKSPTAGESIYYRVVIPGTWHEREAVPEHTEEEMEEYAEEMGEEEETEY